MSDEKRPIGDARSQLGFAKARIALGEAFGRVGAALGGRPVRTQQTCSQCGNNNDATALACRRCGKELIV